MIQIMCTMTMLTLPHILMNLVRQMPTIASSYMYMYDVNDVKRHIFNYYRVDCGDIYYKRQQQQQQQKPT